MDIPSVQKLQAFLKAFQESGFKPDIKQIPSYTVMKFREGPVNILINKTEAIQLLRNNFATFKGDAFKDDNAILKWLSNPANRNSFISKLTTGERQELGEYLKFKEYQPVEAGEQTATNQEAVGGEQGKAGQETQPSGPGTAIPSFGGLKATASQPRIIYSKPTPKVPEEGKKLYVANKSGQVVEERTVTAGGSMVKKPETPSGIAIANKSGVVTGERPLDTKELRSTGPKLVTANKSGIVNEPLRGEKILSLANKSGQIVGEKLVKNLESDAQIGIKKGLTNVGRGVGEMAKGLGKGLGGLAQGTLGGMANGGGMLVRRVGLPAADRLPLFSNQLSRGGIKPPGGKKALFLLLGLLLLLMVVGALTGSSSVTAPGGTTAQNQITISKTGPGGCTDCTVKIDEPISYTIKVTYLGTGTANITVTDKLDAGVSKDPSDITAGNGTVSSDTVSWNLSNISPNQLETISLTVKPTIPSDSPGIWVVNQAQATITSISGGAGGGSASTTCPKCQHDPPNFVQLMTGNGRKNPFSDADSFAKTVETNGSSNHLSLSSAQDTQIRSIYKEATDAKVNPLAVLTIWGVEKGFSSDNSIANFGVVAKDKNGNQICANGFDNQLACAVTSLNNRMNDFANGHTSFPQTDCTYTDDFLYAYEWYTPICHTFDNNLNARPRFVELYTKLGGGQ